MSGGVPAQATVAGAGALAEDAGLYAAAYVCGEEPDAERLKATALLVLAGSGTAAANVAQARQQFLDQLRKQARLSRSECRAVRGRLESRLQELDSLRIEPARR